MLQAGLWVWQGGWMGCCSLGCLGCLGHGLGCCSLDSGCGMADARWMGGACSTPGSYLRPPRSYCVCRAPGLCAVQIDGTVCMVHWRAQACFLAVRSNSLLDGPRRRRQLSHALAMGNQPSSSSRAPTPGGSSSHPQSPVAGLTSPTSLGPFHDRERAQQHNPRRRESIQALSTVFDRKASIAPPSASLESAAALTAPARPRSRSHTVSAATTTTAHVANTLRAAQDTLRPAEHDRMGNEQSRPRGLQRDLTPPKPKPPPVDDKPMPSPRSAPKPLPIPRDRPHSHGTSRPEPIPAASLEPADASTEAFVVPSSHYSRPPRLPLPIEEEPVGPGSPIISPADPTSRTHHDDVDGALPRRSSMLSDKTADPDDDDLADEFKGPQGQVTVPTLIEWEGPGERVFVTGTFAGWERKFKLHPE